MSQHTEDASEKQKVVPTAATGPPDGPSPALVYPSSSRFAVTLVGLCSAVFCVALDNTVLTTAIPRITDDFHALQDVGWYGSAYLLTNCGFQLMFGKFYSCLDVKWTFLACLLLFEIGSLICGIAPNSTALIIGRAIAGVGSAGIFVGAMVTIAFSTPIHKRAFYQSIMGMMFGIASVVGPLIGGAFTDNVTWRWCFYINLPIGGLTAAIVLFVVKVPPAPGPPKAPKTLAQFFWSLDPIGTVLFVGSIACLLLALQWGGSINKWGDARIIVLLVLFGVLLIAFVAVQIWLGEGATVPPRIVKQRTIWSVSVFNFCIGGAFFLLVYFIPIWFQAIKGTTALYSGIDTIPLIVPNVIGILLSGILVGKFGHYMPFFIGCVVLTSIGSALITLFTVDTSIGKWIGYQILYGFGNGIAFTLPQVVAQAVLTRGDIPVGIAVTVMAQRLGAAIFVSAGSNILDNKLVEYIGNLHIPNVDAQTIINLGATEIRTSVPAEYQSAVIFAYNAALVKTFEVALILSCLSFIGAAFMEWKKVQGSPPSGGPGASGSKLPPTLPATDATSKNENAGGAV